MGSASPTRTSPNLGTAMDAKLKHLEFVQNVITRMNTNSFMTKGWVATIVAALFALATKDSDHRLVYVAWFAIPMFWILDGFYLSQERQYRLLYDHLRAVDPGDIDFDMSARPFRSRRTTWPAAILSWTLVIYYGVLLAASVAVAFILTS